MRLNRHRPLLLLLSVWLCYADAFAALQGGTVFELRATATAGMVNGIGFNANRGGTDYTQQDSPQVNNTDLSSVTTSSTVTSAGVTFTSAMVGNTLHITTLGTGNQCNPGWYEIVTFTDSHNVILDVNPSTGTGCSGSTYAVGGAGSLNSTLDDAFFEILPASSTVWVKSGNFTTGQSIVTAASTFTTTAAGYVIGYNNSRGDNPVLQQRPLINMGANTWTPEVNMNFLNVRITGTTNAMVATALNNKAINSQFFNSSATAGRSAATMASEVSFSFCDIVSLNGQALNMGNNGNKAIGCFIHDSDNGILSTAARMIIDSCVIANHKSMGLTASNTTGSHVITHNTWYGSEAQISTGIITTANVPDMMIANNIFYGFQTAIKLNTLMTSDVEIYNDFFNNQTSRVNLSTGAVTQTLNPQFVNASQITGSAATTSGSVLTDATKDFSVVVDSFTYLRVSNSTGGTLGNYQITSHTGTTLTTNNALGSGSSVIYTVTSGQNYALGPNLKGDAAPSLLGYSTTNYLDIGAVQRQEPTLSGIFFQ